MLNVYTRLPLLAWAMAITQRDRALIKSNQLFLKLIKIKIINYKLIIIN